MERFLAYVQIDTQSNETVETSPSSEGQLQLGQFLAVELKKMGIQDASVDEHGYVTATLEGDASKGTVGLLAHLDTAPAAPGAGVKPILHQDYDGGDILLSDGVTLVADENPELKRYIGDTIITSDGTTLLGADDKAGIAVIMTAIEYLIKHPEIPHPRIRVCFTPDEEIGRGTKYFPFSTFGADVAYTLDGSIAGEINIETFEASSAVVTFEGVSTHPGVAKGKLVNALKWMGRFIEELPQEQSPEETDGRDGFIHPVSVSGDSSVCQLELILRDFSESKLHELEDRLGQLSEALMRREPRLRILLDIREGYPNMYKFLKNSPLILKRLEDAVRQTGLTPIIVPIRGGTDGSMLTKEGLLCPNIFAGGMNLHDKREWISDRAMALSLCTVLNLMVSHTT